MVASSSSSSPQQECFFERAFAIRRGQTRVEEVRKDKWNGCVMSLPRVQEAPEGRCCPVYMCRSEEGMGT